MRDVVNAIIRKEITFVDDEAIVHFHDVYDRVLRVVDLVESQPELHWQYGYAMALGLMGVSTFILYRMFKRRDWL
jgi:hypothetical protein